MMSGPPRQSRSSLVRDQLGEARGVRIMVGTDAFAGRGTQVLESYFSGSEGRRAIEGVGWGVNHPFWDSVKRISVKGIGAAVGMIILIVALVMLVVFGTWLILKQRRCTPLSTSDQIQRTAVRIRQIGGSIPVLRRRWET